MILSTKQIRKLKNQISNDETKNAISTMFEILDSVVEEQDLNENIKRIYNDLVVISGNQNNLSHNSRVGLISREQFILESNKINNAILLLVDNLNNYKLDQPKVLFYEKKEDSGFEFDVFLCFSSKDINEAKDVWEQLTKSGVKVFMSEEALKFEAGISFMERIEFALENSKNFVFLCTDNSLFSEWVKIEYQTFLSEFHVKDKVNRKLIILKGKVLLTEKIPLLLRRLQFSNSIDSVINSIAIERKRKAKTDVPDTYTLPVQNNSLKEKIKEHTFEKKSNPINFLKGEPSNYVPSNSLTDALDISLKLGLPLLLSGESGVGKTQFAHYASHSLKLGSPYVFKVRSTSKVKDLFYRFDDTSHISFAQISKKVLSYEEIEQRFITYQALGAAIRGEKQKIVLIDKIDTASRDFPNDLLDVIEGLEFYVPELGLSYKATPENRPIIIITTNSEKNLPDAFLRRCVYYNIPFPSDEQLLRILHNRIYPRRDNDFLRKVIMIFSLLRQKALIKKPSVGELIAWVEILIAFDITDSENSMQRDKLLDSLSVLFKTIEDLNRAKEIVSESKNWL